MASECCLFVVSVFALSFFCFFVSAGYSISLLPVGARWWIDVLICAFLPDYLVLYERMYQE